MDRFKYDGRYKSLLVATEELNNFFLSDRFNTLLLRRDSPFLMSSGVDGKKMVEIFRTWDIQCQIQTYRPWWRWSRVLAYYDPRKGAKNIWLNSRKFGRSEASIMGTLAHEYTHLVDNFALNSFGHGNNSAVGKEETAPYWIGRMVYLEFK